jgi:conjugative transposon TraM protein
MIQRFKKLDIKRQPRYMLPLVAIPFLTLLNAVGMTVLKPNAKQAAIAATNQMNTELQDPDLEKAQTMNKFDALFSAYDKKEDFSAIQDLEGIGNADDKAMELDNKNLYSMSEMDKITRANGGSLLSLSQGNATSNYSLFKNANGRGSQHPLSMQANFQPNFAKIDNTEVNRSFANYDGYLNSTNSANSQYETEPTPKAKPNFDENMALFRAQMAVIDSMSNKRKIKSLPEKPTFEEEVHETTLQSQANPDKTKPQGKLADKVIEVTKSDKDNSRYFNTVGLSQNNSFIKAILDEGLKVYDGSRVRIRLLDNIFLDGKELQRGSYLYGIITGFATQRVHLTITNIAYNNEILTVKLEVYDQDGMKGLYIPESLFREIAKEASAQSVNGQNLQFSDNNTINATQMAYTAAQDIYKTSTRAMSEAIRKRKAILKYNTQIFLVNSK